MRMQATLETQVPLLAAAALLLATGALAGDRSDVGDERPRVAVVGFAGAALDPRDAWLPTAVEELLTMQLRRERDLIVWPTERLHQALQELRSEPHVGPSRDESAIRALPDAAAADWNVLLPLIGVTHRISGTVSGTPDAVLLELSIDWPTAPGESVAEGKGRNRAKPRRPVTAQFGLGRLFETTDPASRWATQRLLESAGATAASAPVSAALPPAASPSAVEFYAKALLADRAGRPRDALDALMSALEYDPRHRASILLLARLEPPVAPDRLERKIARLRALGEAAARDGDPHARAEVELIIGRLLAVAGESNAAVAHFHAALALADEMNDPFVRFAALLSLGDLLLSARPPREPPLDADTRNRLEQQHLRRAAALLEEALRTLEGLSDRVTAIPVRNKLALVYERSRRDEDARAMLEQSLALSREAGARGNQVTACMFLGQWHARRQHWDQALALLRECESLADDRVRPAVWIALAELHRGMPPREGGYGGADPNAAEAVRYYQMALAALRSGRDLEKQLLCARQIAALQRAAGERDAARTALQEAIDIAHALELPLETELRDLLTKWRAEDGR